MRKYIVPFIIAVTFTVLLFLGSTAIQINPAEASSPLTDQWVPVTRSVSITSTDADTWFTWTSDYVFNGIILDDITIASVFTGHKEMSFICEIEDAAAAPDEFMWSSDGGVNWTTGVGMTGAPQTLTEGVTVDFAAVAGHCDGESWHWTEHTVGHSDVGDDVFTGAGLDDCTPSGPYNGHALRLYRVLVDASVPSPDTFSWSQDGGTTWIATGVDMLAAGNHLSENLVVTFAAQDGHAVGDYWDVIATPASQQLLIGSINWTCTAVKAASYVQAMDSLDENQFDVFSFETLGNGEVIYDPPVYLPIGRDLKMDTTATDTGVIYFNVNAWLRDVD